MVPWATEADYEKTQYREPELPDIFRRSLMWGLPALGITTWAMWLIRRLKSGCTLSRRSGLNDRIKLQYGGSRHERNQTETTLVQV